MHCFSLFYILISDGRSAAALHSMDLLPKLIFKLSDPGITIQKVKVISGVITSLIKAHFSTQDISRYLRIHQKPLYMMSAALMTPLLVCSDLDSSWSTHFLHVAQRMATRSVKVNSYQIHQVCFVVYCTQSGICLTNKYSIPDINANIFVLQLSVLIQPVSSGSATTFYFLFLKSLTQTAP